LNGSHCERKSRDSGEFWVFINHKGKRKSKKIGSKKAANQAKKDIEIRLARNDLGFLKRKPSTLRQYGQQYVDNPLYEWADRTRKNYQDIFRLYIDTHEIANKPLDEIRRKQVRDWIGDLKGRGLSKPYIRHALAVLSGIFESAITDELVEINPTSRMGKYIGSDTAKGVGSYTAEEAQVLLDNAKSYGPTYHAAFTLLLRTGMRVGELLALEWSDVSFEERTAQINKNWDIKGKKLGPPKNKKIRDVDLSYFAVAALKEVREIHGDKYQGPIFLDESGERLIQRAITL
jgi:integrase